MKIYPSQKLLTVYGMLIIKITFYNIIQLCLKVNKKEPGINGSHLK